MSLRIGALFAGMGGLDIAVMDTLDAELAWYAEFDKAPAKVMAHHHPDVPNLWDVTKVDWAAVEPVDIITGGSPCQDLSHAGKRKGMKAGTRSGLWASMCDAIDIIRPALVVWENVRGALSAEADSELEPCPGCVGGGDDGPVLRALGRVLGDLAELGFDARWYGLRAADVGAPHGRFRIFLFATPADSERGRWDGWAPQPQRREVGRVAAAGSGEATGPVVLPGQLTLLPTPRTSDTNGAGAHGQGGPDLRTVVDLLPTPRATRGGSATETTYLLPTPMVGSTLPAPHGQISGQWRDAMAAALDRWGDYGPAIARWETALGRTAPAPTEPGRNGNHRLSPAFVEWMMGLPDGHVTDPAIGLTRNEQLKALGNGVVPPQAGAALRAYLRDESEAAA